MIRKESRPRGGLDPHPREYPDLVTLVRRTDSGPEAAPEVTTCDEIRSWLLHDALREDEFMLLLRDLIRRMVAAGLPVDRITVHVGTLHPQLLGFYWYWNRDDGLVDELQVDLAGYEAERYRRSPLSGVIEQGVPFRASTGDPAMAQRYPLLMDLKAQGIHDYCVVPMSTGKAYHNAATLGTCRESGFNEAELTEIKSILEIFALHVERQIMRQIAENVLDTYLGRTAGRKVLSGTIRRGSGESIHAIIWMSDLRGFSELADRLPGPEVLTVLNEYFECLTTAVIENDGEVLKFIGDGLLAVFPIREGENERTAAGNALAAAQRALQNVARLNDEPGEHLRRIEGWHPLGTGIALHWGEIFFGNIGGPERLDFTVIGRAVNEASRVESLTKALHRPILITEPVAVMLDRELDAVGSHQLRGFSGQVRLYSVPSSA